MSKRRIQIRDLQKQEIEEIQEIEDEEHQQERSPSGCIHNLVMKIETLKKRLLVDNPVSLKTLRTSSGNHFHKDKKRPESGLLVKSLLPWCRIQKRFISYTSSQILPTVRNDFLFHFLSRAKEKTSRSGRFQPWLQAGMVMSPAVDLV